MCIAKRVEYVVRGGVLIIPLKVAEISMFIQLCSKCLAFIH